MQTGFELTVQIAQYKDNKQQQQHEKMDASRGTPTSSYIPDDMTEGLDGKSQSVHVENRTKREGDTLQPERFTSMGEISNLEELAQPDNRPITAADLELEKMRWDSALMRLKHKHEDNEKQRQHEKTMEEINQQATSRSFGQGLHDLLRPQNQYTLFLYCFIFIHLIYTVRELAFYFVIKHYLFCFAIVLCFIFKKIFQDYKNKKKCC
ncbi:transmembrane protein 247-like isoform X2 [Pelodiscus sinensis]